MRNAKDDLALCDKATPGPWEGCHDGECKCGYIFGDGGKVFVAKAIGEGDMVDPYPNRETQIANAKLLIAAPDLLEACKDALAFVEELDRRGIAQEWSGEGALKAAIEKAEGVAE